MVAYNVRASWETEAQGQDKLPSRAHPIVQPISWTHGRSQHSAMMVLQGGRGRHLSQRRRQRSTGSGPWTLRTTKGLEPTTVSTDPGPAAQDALFLQPPAGCALVRFCLPGRVAGPHVHQAVSRQHRKPPTCLSLDTKLRHLELFHLVGQRAK